ncbi:hypothetical protein PRIPAC_82797 [Pristionchus pacificus]|nr:hypothetical protein PRIPAC_82797 [Pristionchus pacificus]|eukprot:PDM80252.1 hypothetical protein PRIPAC_32831 [Pristionchus pacificus]
MGKVISAFNINRDMVPVDRRSASSTDSPARAREWRMRGEEEKRASQPTAMEERMTSGNLMSGLNASVKYDKIAMC